MVERDSQADEEELQEILERAPDPSKVKCIFCEKQADAFIDVEDLGIDPDDLDGDMEAPVCWECWPDDDAECIECLVGHYCSDHMTESEWILARLTRFIGDDEEEYDPDE